MLLFLCWLFVIVIPLGLTLGCLWGPAFAASSLILVFLPSVFCRLRYTPARREALRKHYRGMQHPGRRLFSIILIAVAYSGDSQITLGRKNYMFCGNHESVEHMCVIQSLLATCRNHDVNPRLYLNSVIASMPYFDKASEQDLIRLLPHRWKEYHPEAVMTTPVRQLAK